jgi:FkbM family methyltransferase
MLTRDHVVWAYRLLLDREPESEDVIGPKLAGSQSTRELRHHLVTSAEFRAKNPDYALTNEPAIVMVELPGRDRAVRLFVDLSDHVIGLNIVRGRYESEEADFVREVLGPGDTAIDIGAHVGFFTVQMADLVGSAGAVYAFEPFGLNADLLERSIAENRFDDRVRFLRAAVGDHSGSATLTFPVETLNSGGSYLLRPGTSALAGHLEVTVSLVALDDLEIRRPVRLIKMDVEGAEPLVIAGAEQLIRNDRPIVLSELHPTQLERASGCTVNQLVGRFRALGYEPYHVGGRAWRPSGGGGDYVRLLGPKLDRAADDAVSSVVFLPA